MFSARVLNADREVRITVAMPSRDDQHSMLLPSFVLSLLLTSSTYGALVPSNATRPVIDLGYAAYLGNATTPTGVDDGPVVFFGGIPFAEPPLGDLRWRAPRTLNESKPTEPVNFSDARSYASPCIQQPAAVGVGSEGAHL